MRCLEIASKLRRDIYFEGAGKVTEHITDMSVSLFKMKRHQVEHADQGIIHTWIVDGKLLLAHMCCYEGSYEDQSFKGLNKG